MAQFVRRRERSVAGCEDRRYLGYARERPLPQVGDAERRIRLAADEIEGVATDHLAERAGCLQRHGIASLALSGIDAPVLAE